LKIVEVLPRATPQELQMAADRPTSVVILNPAAGGGAGRRVRAEVERELSRRRVDFEIVQSEGTGHAVELAADATRRGPGFVIAVGGDGTIHEVANGLLTAPAHTSALAAVSVGTGNDFVKVIDGLAPRTTAFDTIAAGMTRLVDVGQVSWGASTEYFVNAMGTGVDVDVARHIHRSRRLPGGLVYLSAVPRALAGFRAARVRARMDDAVHEGAVMMLAVGNGRSVGGAFRLFPDAVPTDGLLDVCIVDEVRGLAIVRPLLSLLRGTHTGLDPVHMHRARSIDIEMLSDAPLHFQLDGELREAGDARTLRIETRPAVLRVATSSTAASEGADPAGHQPTDRSAA
jgi:diacylglycerol kinase (ATP)